MAGVLTRRTRIGTGQNTNPVTVTTATPVPAGTKVIGRAYATANGTWSLASLPAGATEVVKGETGLSIIEWYWDADGTEDTFQLDFAGSGGATATKWMELLEWTGLASGGPLGTPVITAVQASAASMADTVLTYAGAVSTQPRIDLAFLAVTGGAITAPGQTPAGLTGGIVDFPILDTSGRIAAFASRRTTQPETPKFALSWTTSRSARALISSWAEEVSGGGGGDVTPAGAWGPIRGF